MTLNTYTGNIDKLAVMELKDDFGNDFTILQWYEYEGKQYNANYEFGGKIVAFDNEKSVIEIKNKLKVGDEVELLVPNNIEPTVFKIEKMWDYETDEEIVSVTLFGVTLA